MIKGDKYPSKYGEVEIIKYVNAKNVQIKFLNTGFEQTTRADRVRSGQVWDKTCTRIKECKIPDDMKLGNIFKTHNFGYVEVLRYLNSKEVLIKFLDTGNTRQANTKHIRNGQVRDYYKPTVFGIGITGKTKCKVNGKNTELYNCWHGMLGRAYCNKLHTKYPTYEEVEVCEEWWQLEKFKLWFDVNYKKGYHLDKDILKKGNKIYSPETARFVPQRLNGLVITNKSLRNKDLPIGVSRKREDGKYCARCHIGECQPKVIGYYDTPELAFNAYKAFKENLVKSLAKEYFNSRLIPEDVYNALMNYKVDKED